MDPKKKDYLVSLGLKPDATDDEAMQFYNLLSPEKQADADAAEAADETPAQDAAEPPAGDAAPAAAKAKPAADAKAATLPDLIAACDGDKAVAADYFLAGMNAGQAKAAYAAIKAQKEQTAAAEQRVKQLEFAGAGRKPVATGSGKAAAAADAADFEKIADHKARAKAEYAADLNGCKNDFSTEAAYCGYRVAELKGQVKRKAGK